MKLDFNREFLNLEGKAIKSPDGNEMTLNVMLGNAIVASAGKEDILKFLDWGLKLVKGEILDLDRTDQKLLRKTIEGLETINILAKGRFLEVMDKKEPETSELSAVKD